MILLKLADRLQFSPAMRKLVLALSLVLTASLLGEQTVTVSSVQPAQLPYYGADVTILGNNLSVFCDLSSCVPLRVDVDGVSAPVRERANDRLVVNVRAHEIGLGTIQITREDGVKTIVRNALTFLGADEEETVLVPMIVAERAGAFGSRWATSFVAFNGDAAQLDPLNEGSAPAHVLWRDRINAQFDAMHLRVRDLNREGDASWGTEIPIVREQELRVREVNLLEIPTDRNFRVSLRLYTVAPFQTVRRPASCTIEVARLDPCCLIVPRQQTVDMLEPAPRGFSVGTFVRTQPSYLEMNDFLAGWPEVQGARLVRITIRAVSDVRPPLFWAFASITHNSTQHVSLVTPSERR